MIVQKRFSGKIVLITGATSGIGQKTAELFAKDGAKVVVCGRNKKRGHETIDMIEKAGGEGIFVTCDVSKKDDIKDYDSLTLQVDNASAPDAESRRRPARYQPGPRYIRQSNNPSTACPLPRNCPEFSVT